MQIEKIKTKRQRPDVRAAKCVESKRNPSPQGILLHINIGVVDAIP